MKKTKKERMRAIKNPSLRNYRKLNKATFRSFTRGRVGKLLALSDDKPMQKVLGTLAAGALGGKLLGLSKKEDVSLQKVLPLAALAVPAAASLASGMMGGGKKSDDKEDDEAIQKVVGKLISGVGQKVQGLGLQEDDEEKEELQKHRGKSFHSHKRKSPFSSRRRR